MWKICALWGAYNRRRQYYKNSNFESHPQTQQLKNISSEEIKNFILPTILLIGM
jgi:hypothetical protein